MLLDAYTKAERQLTREYRDLTRQYINQIARNSTPQDLDFIVRSDGTTVDISREEPLDFNRQLVEKCFAPVINFAPMGRVPIGEDIRTSVTPLWIGILEAKPRDWNYVLLCYQDQLPQCKNFVEAHRICNAEDDLLFGMTTFFTGAYDTSDQEISYKPFVIRHAIGYHARPDIDTYPDIDTDYEGINLNPKFVNQIDDLILVHRNITSEPISGQSEQQRRESVKTQIKLIGDEIKRAWQDRNGFEFASRHLQNLLSKNSGLMTKFIYYLVWLRLIAYEGGVSRSGNWVEYWYIPSPDPAVNSVHAVTIALKKHIDENYFHFVSGAVQKVFSLRAAVKYASQEADNRELRAQINMRRANAHALQRKLAGLARIQYEITKDISTHGGMLRAEALSLQQELIYQFLEIYQRLLQRMVKEPKLTEHEEKEGSLSVLPFDQFLQTIDLHTQISSQHLPRRIAETDDDRLLENIRERLKRIRERSKDLFDALIQQRSIDKIDRSWLAEQDDWEGIRSLTRGERIGFKLSDGCSRYELHITTEEFISLYAAFTEIFENSIKHGTTNVFCDVIEEDGSDYQCVWLTTTNQSNEILTYQDKDHDYTQVKTQVKERTAGGSGPIEIIPPGGAGRFGLEVIKQYLTHVNQEIRHYHYKFDQRIEGKGQHYFWTEILIPKRTSKLRKVTR